MEIRMTRKQMVQRGEDVLNNIMNKLSEEDADCLNEYLEDLCQFAISDAFKLMTEVLQGEKDNFNS